MMATLSIVCIIQLLFNLHFHKKVNSYERITRSQENTILDLMDEKKQLDNSVALLSVENEDLKLELDERSVTDPIDEEFKDALSKWNGNTMEGVSITSTFADKQKVEMEKYYQLLLEKIESEKQQLLISSQEEWENHIKSLEHLRVQIYEQSQGEGASLILTLIASDYYDKFHDRATELKQLCKILPDEN